MGSALYQSLYGEGITLAQVQEIATGASQASRNVNISVAHIEDLDFQVSSGAFYLAGVRYEIAGEVVTLDPGDGTHPRFDVIVAETDGTAGVVEGTPAADPAIPEVNPDTQFALVEVLIAQSATTPSNITDTIVYDEDDDWTSAEVDSGTNVDVAATADPNNGSVHIEFDAAANGDAVTLTDSATHSPTEFETLVFAIKNTVANTNNNQRPRIALYNGAERVSEWIDLRHGAYGFDGNDTSAYQNIIVPIEDFQLGGSQFDVVRFQVAVNGANTRSFNLDDIKFQVGASVVFVGVTQEDVDIAVLNKPETIIVRIGPFETDLSTADYELFFLDYPFEFTGARARVVTAPTGAAIEVDVTNETQGVDIIEGNPLTIDATETDSDTGTAFAFENTTVAAGDIIKVQVTQVGSSNAGQDLIVSLTGHQL